MLYDNEFDLIWENIIKDKILTASELFGLKYKSLFYIKLCLKYYYNKYKDIIVKTYMVLDTKNIDRHKIASCLLKAILIVKPLYIPLSARIKFVFSKKSTQYDSILNHHLDTDSIKNIKKYFIFFNEYLALNIVIGVIESYINSDETVNRLKHGIEIPEPFPKPDDEYLLDFCIGLHYSKLRQINPILIANTLFLWEKYSCRKAKCNNLECFTTELLKKQGLVNDDISKIIFKVELNQQDNDNTK